MTDPSRTRLRHKRNGMIVDLWMPANAVTYGTVMSALGRLGFELRREDNDEQAVFNIQGPPDEGRVVRTAPRPPPRDTGDRSV
jgi:hypothetical protein